MVNNSFFARSVTPVVERNMKLRRKDGDPNPEDEKKVLEQLGKEAEQWVEQAALLMTELLVVNEEEEEEKEVKKDDENELPQMMLVMGKDLNLHPKSLKEIIDEVLFIMNICMYIHSSSTNVYTDASTSHTHLIRARSVH